MVNYAAVLWDLDGTIVDSLPVIYEAFSEMLSHFGKDGVTLDWMRSRIGKPFVETIQLMGLGEEAREYYRRVYFSLGEKHKPFEGVVDVLGEMYGKIPLVIVSNKSREGIRHSLSSWDGGRWFDLIVSENDVRLPKPAPEAFDVVVQFWREQGKRLEPSDVLMVGDTGVDEGFARAVGMDFAFVSWGYGMAEQPTCVVSEPSQLLTVVGLDEEMPLCHGAELDLHGFASRDVKRVVHSYLAEAIQKGYREVRLISGKGRSVRKMQVEGILKGHPLVASFRESHPLCGGWGSYHVQLREE